MPTDNIYATNHGRVRPFQFNEQVAAVFADMIGRSVPGYTLTLPLIGLWAGRYAQPHTLCYDLGCSLGAATLAMRHQIRQPGVRIIAVDNSAAMLRHCRRNVSADGIESGPAVDLVQADMRQVPITNASVVVLNFTLQFIAPDQRGRLVQSIYDGLVPGGILLLSEKVIFADPDKNGRFIDIHHDFKRANGYSDLEISQKRTAIENVLVPETPAVHEDRLRTAGFDMVEVWFQAFNFMGLIAIKQQDA